MLDRFYGLVEDGEFSSKNLYFVFQGASPKKWMMEAGEFTIKRFANLYGFNYMGMVTDKKETEKLSLK